MAASVVAYEALAWGGLLFVWSCVPYRKQTSSRWMIGMLLGTNTVYIGIITAIPHAALPLTVAAALYGAGPLLVTFLAIRRGFNHPLRWVSVVLYAALSAFLLAFQLRTPNGSDLAFNAVFFTVYYACCIHFWYAFRRATAGAMITIAGFLAWSAVFVVAPLMEGFWPALHVESEVWNLPKYVVAVGMILLLLEDQIEHNKYLALHDELTGLPNRRLFQDRLTSAIERARRSGSRAGLLLIDLDHFKQVNDTAGHHVGDLLLQRVSQIFLGRSRRSDTVARTGGDEFSVILEEPITRADAVRVGQSLAELLTHPHELGGHTVRVGASIGVAIFPDDASDPESLRIAADLNMYAEKNVSHGRDRGVREALSAERSTPR